MLRAIARPQDPQQESGQIRSVLTLLPRRVALYLLPRRSSQKLLFQEPLRLRKPPIEELMPSCNTIVFCSL